MPWRRKWQHTSVFLPGESHEQRSLAGYSPWGCKSRTRLSDLTIITATAMCLFTHALKCFFDMEGLNYTIFICDVNNDSLHPKLFTELIVFAKHYFRCRWYHYEGNRHTHKKTFPFMEFRGKEETKQKNKIHSA